jgi:hypothetical protein
MQGAAEAQTVMKYRMQIIADMKTFLRAEEKEPNQ